MKDNFLIMSNQIAAKMSQKSKLEGVPLPTFFHHEQLVLVVLVSRHVWLNSSVLLWPEEYGHLSGSNLQTS